MKKLSTYIIIVLIILMSGWLYLNRDKGQPIENFEAFFKVFKENYAHFEVKGIDWDKEYDYYFERVNEKTTDDELFSIFQEILRKLDDKHCYIYRFNEIYFSGFGLHSLNYLDLTSFYFRLPTNDFSLELIENGYLIDYEKSLKVKSLLPITLLTNANTQSAAELFTLMMKTSPSVKLIGDTTSGVFADTHIGKLPNGWEYRLSIRKTNDWTDNVVEDIGIIPDSMILNTKSDIQNLTDKVLDYAIEYIEESNNNALCIKIIAETVVNSTVVARSNFLSM